MTGQGPIRILLVEDSADDAFLVERALIRGGLQPDILRVETAEAMTRALAEPGWDVVLADYRLPGFGAMEALRLVKGTGLDLPFIVVTGTIGEERAAELLRAGAHDFLLKENLGRLAPVVERELREAEVRTEMRQVEAELERADARYRALIENASDVIYVIDAQGRIRFASPTARELVGMEPENLDGADAFQFVHEDDLQRIRSEFGRVLAEGGRRQAEYRVVRADGEIRHVESVATNLLGDPAVAGVIVNTRDLTERKALEDQLLHSQKMEAVGRLAGGIAHDFNNLLTVITGNIEMVLMGLEPGSAEHEDAVQVLSAAERASALTRQLLAFSRRQVVNLQIVDVNRVVLGVEDMLRRMVGADLELRVAAAEESLCTRMDPVHLEQILMNLAVNAREAMPDGGRVGVRVERSTHPLPLSDGGAAEAGAMLRLTFSDNGPGIPEDIQERIFEPFFSTKAMGTGLGLSTVYGIVRQCGGEIRVESTPGAGATFHIYLPEAVCPERSDTAAPSRPRRILLVDDSPEVRKVTARALALEGYEVTQAGSGDEALEAAERSGGHDLLVTDLVMPGLSGVELARRIRETRPGLRTLYMSGYSEAELPLEAEMEAGCVFLQKPFTPDELNREIRRMLTTTDA